MKKYFAILPLILLMACSGNTNKVVDPKDSVAKTENTSTVVQPTFKDQKVAAIYANYLQLKDALVATKDAEAKAAAKELIPELKSYTGCENTAIIAEQISNAKDIVAQRKEFTALSKDIIALFKNADLTSGTVYVQHCPMANNGDGGDWLASEKKIQNPYYGKDMLECGAVVAEIKAK
ncbi:MAG: DUF3347 domain-containing protein [Pedobacter sp.]|nr:DUF3347 domain-containing protein [Pedobacter sp.]